jgi:hypothetical protein
MTRHGVDESRTRLHRAGWSVGEYSTAAGWVVTGANGEILIHAPGATQGEAWHPAVEQTRSVGMLGPDQEPWRWESTQP